MPKIIFIFVLVFKNVKQCQPLHNSHNSSFSRGVVCVQQAFILLVLIKSPPKQNTNIVLCSCSQCQYIPPYLYHYCLSKLNFLTSQNSLIILHMHTVQRRTVALCNVSLPKTAFSLTPPWWALGSFSLRISQILSPIPPFFPALYLLCLSFLLSKLYFFSDLR